MTFLDIIYKNGHSHKFPTVVLHRRSIGSFFEDNYKEDFLLEILIGYNNQKEY